MKPPKFILRFEPHQGLLYFAGEAMPDRNEDELEECKRALREYVAQYQQNLHVKFAMVYYNTKISRYFADILNILEDYAKQCGKRVNVKWLYQKYDATKTDIDMLDAGAEFADTLEALSFEYGQFELDADEIPKEIT